MAAVNAGFIGDDGEEVIICVAKSTTEFAGPKCSVTSLKTQVDRDSEEKKRPQITAALAAAFGAFLLGTSFGWSSPVQPQLQQSSALNNYTLPNSTWYLNLDDDQLSWVNSLLNVGALCGAITGGFLMDRFGRKFILMAMSVPYVIGWLLISLAIHPSMLCIGRVIVGYSGGVCSAIAPAYIGEISTPKMRGIVGFFFSVNLASGLLVTSVMGLWLDWRWISGICTIEPILFLIGLSFIPESPYYLVKTGRHPDASKALNWLRGSRYNVQDELRLIQLRVEKDANEGTKLSDINRPWIYKPVVIGVILMVLQQFSGMNAVSFNAAEIFRIANFTYDRLVGVVLIQTVQVSSVVLSSSILVKRFNRKVLFVIAEGLACLSMVALGLFFYQIDAESSQSITFFNWLPLASMMVFFAAIGLGLGPLPWLISSEVLPAKFRGPGSSIIAFSNFAGSFIVTKTFVDLQRLMTHSGVFWFYAGISFSGILFGLFVLPETKDRTPEQIQSHFKPTKK